MSSTEALHSEIKARRDSIYKSVEHEREHSKGKPGEYFKIFFNDKAT